ncbi:MAG: Gfo/Idh/MocA family oxidoreductase [bacterium]|nr:Gfo/Idh/MocA family oxidoreductase [bacterium]
MKRVGLMGCGTVAMYGHLPAIKNAEGLDLVSIFDPNEENLAKAKEKYGVPNAFTDAEAFFASDIDAISITSPAPCHKANVLDAARHGKHVICEKPLAMDEAEAEDMIAAMDKAGLMLFTGFTYRFAPLNRKVKDLVDQGVVGDILSLRLIYIWNCHGRYETDEHGNRIEQQRREGRMLEGGPMVDCGTHQIDLSRWWLKSDVTRYHGVGAWLQDYEAPDHMYVHMDHENGAHTMVEISYSYCHTAEDPVHIYSYDLIGTEGVIRHNSLEDVFEVRSSSGTKTFSTAGAKNFDGMYEGFAKALETGDPGDMPTGRDGLIATRIARTATEEAIRNRGK